jgi:tetratricopeptide (TPR) repeat protein
MKHIISATILPTIVLLTTSVPAWSQSRRIDALNRAFVEHVRGLGESRSDQAKAIVRSLKEDYVGDDADGFVPDSLSLLYPEFQEAIDAFDDDLFHAAAERLEPLTASDDRFLATNAGYFYARSLIERGMLEEAETFLNGLVTKKSDLAGLTPYAGHFWFVKGFCQFGNLRFDAATESLENIARRFAEAPEPVRVGAEQLLLEIKRREIGTLDEVSSLMGYAAGRLKVSDAAERVRQRQDEAVKLLDKLIKKAEEQEKQQCQGGGKSGQGGKKSPKQSSNPAQKSTAPAGGGRIGELRPTEKADPGEMWGKLPSAERDKILQSLRDRFPSRYRELVEQYYRALAEDK